MRSIKPVFFNLLKVEFVPSSVGREFCFLILSVDYEHMP